MDKKTVALGLLIAGALSSAYAAPDNGSFYTGAKVGWSAYHNTDFKDPTVAKSDASSNSVGYGGYVGYQVHPNVAFELGYDELGKMKYKRSNPLQNEASYQVRGVQLSAKLSAPLSDDLDVYGRLGTMSWRGQSEIAGRKFSENGVSPLIAAGFELDVTDSIAARLEYQWVENVGKQTELRVKPDNGMVSLGVAYRFGQKAQTVDGELVDLPETLGSVSPDSKVFTLKAEVLFDFAKHSLTPKGKITLDNLFRELIKQDPADGSVFIIGYTDRIGGEEFNHKLSERRSESVVNYLVNKGIPRSKINAIGLGKENSVTGNSCENVKPRSALISCLASDRRVEIEIKGVTEDMVIQ